ELLLQERQGLNKTNKLYLVKPEVTEDDIYKIQKQENTVESSNGKEVGKTDFKKSIKQNLMILNLAILNLTILK
ncbi:replication protein A, partial [Staphylococcus aureus]